MTRPHHHRDRSAFGRIIGVTVALTGLLLSTTVACSGGEQKPQNAAGAAPAPKPAAPSTPSAPPAPSAPKAKPKQPPKAPEGGGGAKPAPAAPAPSDPAAAEARKYAQTYADAINAQDTNKMVSLVCDLTKVEKVTYVRYFNKQFQGGKAKVTLVGPTVTKGKLAQTRAKSVAAKGGKKAANALTITMQKQGAKWCIPSRG
jgi:hypothetical protein